MSINFLCKISNAATSPSAVSHLLSCASEPLGLPSSLLVSRFFISFALSSLTLFNVPTSPLSFAPGYAIITILSALAINILAISMLGVTALATTALLMFAVRGVWEGTGAG